MVFGLLFLQVPHVLGFNQDAPRAHFQFIDNDVIEMPGYPSGTNRLKVSLIESALKSIYEIYDSCSLKAINYR